MVLVVGAGYLGNGETDVIFTGLRLSPMQWVRNCRTRRQFREKWEEEEKSNCFEKKSKVRSRRGIFHVKDDNVSCIYGNENMQEKHLNAESTYISIPEVMMVRMSRKTRQRCFTCSCCCSRSSGKWTDCRFDQRRPNSPARCHLKRMLIFVSPISTEPTPNESDLNPIEQLKTDLNRKSLWKRTSTKLPLGQTSPSSSSPPRLCCREKTTSSSSSSSWRWSRCKDTSAQSLSKKLLNLKMIQGNR